MSDSLITLVFGNTTSAPEEIFLKYYSRIIENEYN